MVNDGQVARNQLVLQHTALRNLDLVTLVSDNDDGTTEGDVPTENNVALHCKVVKLDHFWDRLETLLELGDLLERVTELDDGRLGEHAAWVHDQLAVLERVEIRSDEQEIGARLDRQETRSWHIDTLSTAEVLDGSTDGSLELDDGFTGIERLVVDNNLQVELLVFEDTLDRAQVEPQIVGVEDLELLDRLEILDVLRGHLGDFEKTDSALVVDQRTTLDVGLGLVSDFRDELGLSVDHVLVDVEVDVGTQIVDVGDEKVLLAGRDQAVEETRVIHSIEKIAVTGRIPEVLVVSSRARAGEERLLVDTRIARLVESEDLDIVVGVLLDDTGSVIVRVERVHEDKGDVDVVRAVEVLNLTHGKVEEGHAFTDLDDRFGTGATHGGTKTTVELEHSELVKDRGISGISELGVRSDLLGRRRLNLVPDAVKSERKERGKTAQE